MIPWNWPHKKNVMNIYYSLGLCIDGFIGLSWKLLEKLWTQISLYGYVRCSKKGHNSRTPCVGSHICTACTSTIYRDHVYQVVLLFSSQPNETCHTWSLWRVGVHDMLFWGLAKGVQSYFSFLEFLLYIYRKLLS